MASLTIRKLDEAVKAQPAAARGPKRPFGRGRGPGDPARDRPGSRRFRGTPSAGRPAVRRRAVSAARPIDAPDQAGVTLIIGGGIAAYKALDLIRRLKERQIQVRCVLTRAAQQFVTPLSASALSHERVYTDLFDPESEFDAGHIRLARDCDLIVVAPATADLMAKMAQGHADDLATAILLATNRPILLAPAMNPLMWNNAATRRNVAQLDARRRRPDRPQCRRNGRSGRGRRRPHVRADWKSPPPPSGCCGHRSRARSRASGC